MPVEDAFGVIAGITRSVSVPVTADVEVGRACRDRLTARAQ